MCEGLETTFQLLGKTDNEAAVPLLIAALDSPRRQVQEEALRAILKRRSPAGGREILRRLQGIPLRWKKIIRHHRGRLGRTIRDAVLGTDRELMLNGCLAALWFREYDLMAVLLNLLEDGSQQAAQTAADTLLAMASQLHGELAQSRDHADRRDPQIARQHAVTSLEVSVKRFGRHRRREVIESFLLLVGRDNPTLKLILRDPHHVAFATALDVLSHSHRKGVIRLVLSFLDDPHVPSSVLAVIAKRSDPQFVQFLLRKIGHEPSAVAAQNLKRIESIAWLHDGQALLDRFDDGGQHAAVRLVMTAGLPRSEAFAVVKHFLLCGKPGGRRAAAKTLAEFSGAEANLMTLKALEDEDPHVQAIAASQLRQRGIPGVLARLVELIDSPHAVVRKAARDGLDEFSFTRFAGAFEMLDDEVRRSTGMLVKKIDPKTLPLLEEELRSRVRTRRIRGLSLARAIDVVDQLEHVIVELLSDDDHRVRVEAATALARCTTDFSRAALQQALDDSSYVVRETARKSLDTREQPTA